MFNFRKKKSISLSPPAAVETRQVSPAEQRAFAAAFSAQITKPEWDLSGNPHGLPETNPEWTEVVGHEGLEISTEALILVRLRKGSTGSRVYGRYHTAADTDTETLAAFVADRVAEFTGERDA